MYWRTLGKVLFVSSALPWAIFIYAIFFMDAMGMTAEDPLIIGSLLLAMVMTFVGLALALRK